MDKLPTWELCDRKVNAGEYCDLEKFIYDNEPADGEQWRAELANILEPATRAAELQAENERYREALIKIAEYNHPSNETIQIAGDILGVKEPPALNASRKEGE